MSSQPISTLNPSELLAPRALPFFRDLSCAYLFETGLRRSWCMLLLCHRPACSRFS